MAQLTGKLAQVAISVRDLARATAFYRDTLGLPLRFEAPNVAFFDLQGVRLMLGLNPQAASQPSGTVLYYDVEDLDAEHARLAAAGVHVERAPCAVAPLDGKTLWIGFFRDSEENLFGLTQLR